MRIALVQDHLRMGGTERQTVALANAFAAAGHEVGVFTFRPGGPLVPNIDRKVQHRALLPFDLRLDWFAPGLAHALRAFAPDVVQLMGRMANCMGSRLNIVVPKACVLATFRTGRTIPFLYRRTLRNATAIVANSAEAARRIAREQGVEGSHVHVIRNALTSPGEPAPDARTAIRTTLGTPEEALVFLCTAMLRPGKGHRRLLQAAASLPRDYAWELWIAGEGTERPGCEALARELDLAGRVRFLGLRRDTTDLYAAADVAVLASDTESLPNFLIEAQWLGLPAVACDVAGVGETFQHEISGLLVPRGNATALSGTMQTLARDPERRARMSVAARAYARREFTPSRQNARYLELYETLLKR